MEWIGVEWPAMGWLEWNERIGLDWNGKGWKGMKWNGMEWNRNAKQYDGMEFNGMEWHVALGGWARCARQGFFVYCVKSENHLDERLQHSRPGGVEWNAMKWHGMEMEWHGREWDVME